MLQVINCKAYQAQDIKALTELQEAVGLGKVRREAHCPSQKILGLSYI